MKRGLPRLDETMFPKAAFKLKEIPLENGKGELLRYCAGCGGEGEICKATKTHTKVSGVEKVETIAIKKAQAAHHRKQHWTVTVVVCSVCGGAGVAKAEVAS